MLPSHDRLGAARISKTIGSVWQNVGGKIPALSRDESARLMVYAHNQQVFSVSLVINPERLHAPTPHDSTGAEP